MTEEKDSICCSWYESCTYYMQCEHLYNENKDLSEDVLRLEQENKEEKKAYNECMYYLACMTEQRNKLKIALEEIREILLLPDMPEVKEQMIITSTMLDEIVRAKRENKLQKIKQTIYEVLN